MFILFVKHTKRQNSTWCNISYLINAAALFCNCFGDVICIDFFCVYYMLPYLKVNGAENREWKNSNENYEWVWVRGKCTTEQYQIPISLFWIDSIYSYFSLFYGNENNNRMTNAKIIFIFEGYMLQWNIMESIYEILFNCSDVNFWFPTSWWLRFLLDFWS